VGGADEGVLSGSGTAGAADVAVDRGVSRMHEHDSPSGALSLGGKDGREPAPAGVQDRPVQPGLGPNVGAWVLGGACQPRRSWRPRAAVRGQWCRRCRPAPGRSCGWKSRRWLRTLRHSLASACRSRLRFPEPGRDRALRRCRSAIRSCATSRNRGLATTSPTLVVKNRATPRSIPTDRPVDGSGTGSDSVTTITYQRRPSRLSCRALTRPTTGRCWPTFIRPTAFKLACAQRPPSAGSHLAPSPATNSTWSKR
jgi:hypothetical protein